MTSANTVGYTTQGLTSAKFNMHGVVFTTVDGGDMDLNKDFDFPNLTKGDDTPLADNIQVWDPSTSGYTTYYYYNAEGDEENWGWVDANWELPNAKLACGTAFWFKAKEGDGKAMTQSGAVESEDDVTYDLTGGKFNMHINPWPVAVDLNDENAIVIKNFTPGDDTPVADNIQVWNPATSGYTTFYYYNAEGDEENWGWVDANWELPKAEIPACAGFWYKAKAGDGKQIIFKSPMKK